MAFLRGFLRFRLRTLLILVTVIGVLLGGFAWRRERARQQAAAVATIRQLGGRVIYEPLDEDVAQELMYGEPPLADWQQR